MSVLVQIVLSLYFSDKGEPGQLRAGGAIAGDQVQDGQELSAT